MYSLMSSVREVSRVTSKTVMMCGWLELGGRPGLAERAAVQIGVVLDDLDRHLSPQLQVVGKVDGGERTAPQLAEQTVPIVQEGLLVGHRTPVYRRPRTLARPSAMVLYSRSSGGPHRVAFRTGEWRNWQTR